MMMTILMIDDDDNNDDDNNYYVDNGIRIVTSYFMGKTICPRLYFVSSSLSLPFSKIYYHRH